MTCQEYEAAVPPSVPVGCRPRTGTRRVFVDANTPYDNLGDAVIVRELLRLVRERAGEVQVDARGMDAGLRGLIETGDHDGTIASFLLSAVRGRLGPRAGRVPHTLVLKPGHIGGRYGAGALAGRVGLLGASAIARLLGADVARLGFSVGDLSPALRRVERLQSRLMTTYAPRDSGSVAYARAHGFRVTGQSSDLAFALPVRSGSGSARSVDICFSFRSSLVGPSGPGAYHDQVATLARGLLDRAAGERTTLVWAAQVGSDVPLARCLLRERPEVPLVTFDGTAASADALLDTYRHSRVVVSNRLHTVLLAAAQGTPALAVTDLAAHGKLTDLLRDVGLGSMLIDIGAGADAVWSRIQQLGDDPAPFVPTVREVFAQQRATVLRALDELTW